MELSTPLCGPSVKGQCGGGGVAYPHHLGSAHQEVPDPVAEGGVQSRGDYGVERLAVVTFSKGRQLPIPCIQYVISILCSSCFLVGEPVRDSQ